MIERKLTEEECWLYLILTSPGMSAEFFWTDDNGEPFTLWDYQWEIFDSENSKEIFISARKVAKTTTICARAFTFPFRKPGKTLFLTSAEGVHLERITTELNERIENSYIHRNFYKKASERPHYRRVAWNSSVIFGRVPQKKGTGVKSVHADEVYADEYQDFTPKAKAELSEVFQKEGRRFLSGVPDLGADPHIRRFLESSTYTVYRVPRMFRPDWDEQVKKEKIEEYGSEDSVDYRRNLYGETIEEITTVFPRTLLYNQMVNRDSKFANVYSHYEFRSEIENIDTIKIMNDLDFLDELYLAIDVGWVLAPTTAVIIGEKDSKYYILKILDFYRYTHPDLAKFFTSYLFKIFKFKFISVDSTSGGVSFYQMLKKHNDAVIGIDFRKKVKVDNQDVSLNDFSVQAVKTLLEQGRLFLPYDSEFIQEWSQVSSHKITGTGSMYSYTKGIHSFDAVRTFCASLILKDELFEPQSFDFFIETVL